MPDGGPPARSLSEAERAAEAAAREELCQVCRLLYQRGYIVGHDGNVSLRLGEDQILVTPSGVGKGRLRPGMLVRCARCILLLFFLFIPISLNRILLIFFIFHNVS